MWSITSNISLLAQMENHIINVNLNFMSIICFIVVNGVN